MDVLSFEHVHAPGNYKLLVIVDEFTRYAEVFVIPNEEAPTIANKLMEEFIPRYGISEEIIMDRGGPFISELFTELCRQLRVKKIHTAAYHPQANGANERMHGTLYTILRALTNNKGTDWKRQLPLAMYVYRTAIHKALKMSPHQALYGSQPRHINLEAYFDDEGEEDQDLDDRLRGLIQMHQILRKKMEEEQEKRNAQRNENRELREYEPGDWVKCRIHHRHKLAPYWKGPYRVVKKVGEVDYQLAFPEGDRRHPVIHSNHLRPWHGKYCDEIPGPKVFDSRGRPQEVDQEELELWRPARPMTRAFRKLVESTQARPA
jgi:ribosomal protein L21E